MPLPQVVVDALAAHLAEFPPGPDGLVFTLSGEPVNRQAFGRLWRPAARAAGIADGTGLHLLRHYYASLLIRYGESVKTVQARWATPQRPRRWTPTATCGRTPTTARGRRSTRSSAGPLWELGTMWGPDLLRKLHIRRSAGVADESGCRPGSVPRRRSRRRGDGHPSPVAVADHLQRPTRVLGRAALERTLSGLAPDGVYRADLVTQAAGGLLHHRFTLAPPPANRWRGGLFSVALSRGSPRVAVGHHPALRSPDLPRRWLPTDATVRPTRPLPV